MKSSIKKELIMCLDLQSSYNWYARSGILAKEIADDLTSRDAAVAPILPGEQQEIPFSTTIDFLIRFLTKRPLGQNAMICAFHILLMIIYDIINSKYMKNSAY